MTVSDVFGLAYRFTLLYHMGIVRQCTSQKTARLCNSGWAANIESLCVRASVSADASYTLPLGIVCRLDGKRHQASGQLQRDAGVTLCFALLVTVEV